MKIDKNDYLRATLPAEDGGGGGGAFFFPRVEKKHLKKF